MEHKLNFNASSLVLKYRSEGECFSIDLKERQREFNKIYKSLYLPIYYFARTFVESQDAEDIVADSFFKLWRSDLDYTILPKVKTWLNVCTRNACLDLLRNRKSETKKQRDFVYTSTTEAEDATELEIREELLERLNDEIEKLPSQCKKVFKMAYLDGQTSKEIASILHISENTVSNHRARAFKLLRLTFKSYTYLLLALSGFAF